MDQIEEDICIRIRFVKILKLRKDKQPICGGPLTTEEYINSEMFLLKKAQLEGYTEEYAVLQHGMVWYEIRKVTSSKILHFWTNLGLSDLERESNQLHWFYSVRKIQYYSPNTIELLR